MDASQEHAMLLEALSDKVLHQLPPKVWQELFLGPGRESIRFEQRHLTLPINTIDGTWPGPGLSLHETIERYPTELGRRHDHPGKTFDIGAECVYRTYNDLILFASGIEGRYLLPGNQSVESLRDVADPNP